MPPASSADGTRVDGVVALRKALLGRPEVVVGTMTEKLLTYALGRGLEHYDMPAVRGIVRDGGAAELPVLGARAGRSCRARRSRCASVGGGS